MNQPFWIWRRITREEAEWLDHMRMAKSCANKTPYDSIEDAMRGAIKTHLDHRNQHRKQLYPYQCKICQKWHLTSKQPCAEHHDHDHA